MFRRILIANRGEIAARIARACDSMGVESVIVHSEADRGAPWLKRATRTLCVGGARAAESYLDANAILQAAEQTDCQAVHPGYGFLAENAAFAARCVQQGLTFIGPPAGAIRRMGNKAEAKRTMDAAGLSTIPGSDGIVADADAAAEVAARLGFPVLLKAVSGGGGRGMRLCHDAKQLREGFAQAALEAGQAFGDASLYMEKFIAGGRHIEFQILCDAYGAAVHLGERECSIQRKHQKLVEEAPSPVVDASTRASLGESVAQAAARFGYRNAGTVEFLRDGAGNYYFMEMNTRLQVEHPVTEVVTDVDIVQMQLRIAANEPLPLAQADVEIRGHGFEFRINAEDPHAGFRPDPGEIRALSPPRVKSKGVSVRWDSAIEPGYRIPPHYDSMIGKLIVHAADRKAALEGAGEALGSMVVDGVKTTLPLHRRIVVDGAFARGEYDIDYLARSGLLGE